MHNYDLHRFVTENMHIYLHVRACLECLNFNVIGWAHITFTCPITTTATIPVEAPTTPMHSPRVLHYEIRAHTDTYSYIVLLTSTCIEN